MRREKANSEEELIGKAWSVLKRIKNEIQDERQGKVIPAFQKLETKELTKNLAKEINKDFLDK